MMPADENETLPTGRYARVKAGVAILGLVLLLVLAWQSRHELRSIAGNLRPGIFFAAITAGIALNLLQGIYFAQLMKKNGSGATSRDCLAAFLVGQPGKYLPGKIWAPLIQQASLGRPGQLFFIASSNIELAIVVLLQMTCLGFMCLMAANPIGLMASVGVGILAGAAGLKFRIVAKLVQLLPYLRSRVGNDNQARSGNAPSFLTALSMSTGIMALTLVASWLVLASMGRPGGAIEHASILASVFLGFASSVLAFPVPAGLGVREAATAGIGILAAPNVPAAALVSVAIFARGWQMAVDIASLLIGLYVSRRSMRSS